MKFKTAVSLSLPFAVILLVATACQFPGTNTSTADNKSGAKTPEAPANKAEPAKESAKQPAKELEKPDFTMTSEELDKEFTRKGVKDKDLEKYANKVIRVSGRVTLLSLEKKDTTQPWVSLAAPGLGHGVSCYFDDKDVDQMKALKEDAMVTVQGYQDDFIVPEISPMLKHCAVVEAK